MSKNFRYDRDELERKRQKAQHQERRQQRDHWKTRAVESDDDGHQSLISAHDMRRIDFRGV